MLFDSVRAAIATALPVETLRWITFGHVEADECGAMNQFLAAAHAEDGFGASCLTPATAPTIRSLADLNPDMLAVMHGFSVIGDCSGALRGLADDYERRLASSIPA